MLNKEVCFVGSTHEVNGVHLSRVGGLYLSSQRAKRYWHSLWKCTDSTVFLRKRRSNGWESGPLTGYRVLQNKVARLFYGAARGYDLTFAVSVGTSEDGAFFDAPKRLEKAPHIIFWLLLVEHADKELSVFWKEAKRVTVRGAEIHTIAEWKDLFWLIFVHTIFLWSCTLIIDVNFTNASLGVKLVFQLLHLPRFKEQRLGPTQTPLDFYCTKPKHSFHFAKVAANGRFHC